jgi:hypothetical protein
MNSGLQSLVMFFLLATPGVGAPNNIDVLSHRCDDLSNRKACLDLAKLALTHKDFKIRIQAISHLRDKSTLAQIAEGKDILPVQAAARQRQEDLMQGAQANQEASPKFVIDLPAGSHVRVQLNQQLSFASSKAGQKIFLSVVEDVTLSDVIVIPKGGRATGKVVTLGRKHKLVQSNKNGYSSRNGTEKLDFTIDMVLTVDGIEIPIYYSLQRGKNATFKPGTIFDAYTNLGHTYNRSEKVLADEQASADLRISAIPFVPGKDVLAKLIPAIQDRKVQLAAIKQVTEDALVMLIPAIKDSEVQLAAIKQVTEDALVMLIPAIKDSEVQSAAIEQVANEEQLISLLRNKEVPGPIRIQFLPKIKDQSILCSIFLSDSDINVSHAAANLISERSVLLEAVRNTANSERGQFAVGLINEEKLLADLARTAKDRQTAVAAAEKVSNQDLLGDIAMASLAAAARLVATNKIASELYLTEIAKSEKDDDIAMTAGQRIKNPLLLVDIAKNSISFATRQSALDRITDPLLLAQVARAATDDKVRALAIKRITDSNELMRLAQSDKVLENRILAAKQIKDDGAAYGLAIASKDAKVRIEALRRISDQPSLGRAIIDEKDPAVRRGALPALTNQPLLLVVIQREKIPDVQVAAAIQIRDTSILAKLARLSDGDSLLWERAEALGTQEGYLDYLKLFPQGENADDARSRAKKFGKIR